MTQPRWQPWVAEPSPPRAFVVVGPRAADDAAAMAAVGGGAFAAAGVFGLGLGLAADLGAAVEPAPHEVLRRVGAGLVDDVGEHVGAVGRQALAGDGVLAQAGDPVLVGFLELVRLLGAADRAAGVVHHDHLDPLGTHDGADPAAAGVPGGTELHVGEGDGGAGELHFTGLPDRNAADLVAVCGLHLFCNRVVAEHLQAVVGFDVDLVLADAELVESAVLGLALQHDGGNAEAAEHLRGHSARVGFLDAAGERAFAAHRNPAGHRRCGPAEKPRRDDELVVLAQRMAERRDLLGDDGRGQGTPAQTGIASDRLRFDLGAAGCAHVDPQNFVHGTLLMFKGFQRSALTRSSRDRSFCNPNPWPVITRIPRSSQV